jgi:LuxR family maltose regulon positive regulatory protein
LDYDRQWYRYHHLFQELLQRRLLNDVGSEQVAELHRRAAAWLGGQGLLDEAIRHALAIDDLALAAQLMVAGLCDATNRDDRATCERWLRLLPEDYVERHPWLLMIRALTHQWAWQLGAEWQTLDQIEALLDEGAREGAPDPGVANDLPLLCGMLAAWRALQASAFNQPDRAVACAEEALALLPEQWRLFRGGALLYWALGMQSLGQDEVAQRTLIAEDESSHGKHGAYLQFVLFAACFIGIESGDLEQAGRFGQAMLDVTSSAGMPITSGHARYVLGLVHYSLNELDAAEQHFQELVARRFAIHAQAARNGMIGLTRVHLARADIAAAGRIMELLEAQDALR